MILTPASKGSVPVSISPHLCGHLATKGGFCDRIQVRITESIAKLIFGWALSHLSAPCGAVRVEYDDTPSRWLEDAFLRHGYADW